jgi:hypothetical protein
MLTNSFRRLRFNTTLTKTIQRNFAAASNHNDLGAQAEAKSANFQLDDDI